MSKIVFSPDLFLESQELNRLQRFLGDDGFRKTFLQDCVHFGLIDNSKSGTFTNFKVEQGTNVGTIKHGDGIAIDKNGNLIIRPATDNINVPNNNQWYWLKIKYLQSSIEVGTASVDAAGNLTGVNTKWLEVLRGNPNIPARIRFEGSTLNNDDYDVQEVSSDTNAILVGDFTPESNLKVVVVGSFTPDAAITSEQRDIYRYDGCVATLVLENIAQTPPTLIVDEEFVVARVKNNGGTLTIEDKRTRNLHRSVGMFKLEQFQEQDNPLIGITAVKYDNALSTRVKNYVYVQWGFVSQNWTINPNINTVTLNAGSGGKYFTTGDFSDGQFNGWRLYTKSGNYARVISSVKVGGQINIVLHSLEPTWFNEDNTQQLVIVPDAEEIELLFARDPNNGGLVDWEAQVFPINLAQAKVALTVYASPTCMYGFRYRYKHFNRYGRMRGMPSNSVGYLYEDSFDSTGQPSLTPNLRYPYTSSFDAGFIRLKLHPSAYTNFTTKVDLGDVLGVDRKQLDNLQPVIDINVGGDRQFQIVEGTLTLTTDHYINLSKDGAKNGNKFFFKFENITNLNTFNLRLVQGYVNSGNVGTVLLEFNTFWLGKAQAKNMLVECVFDGTNWIIYPDASVTPSDLNGVLNGVFMADGSVVGNGVFRYGFAPTFNNGLQIPSLDYVLNRIGELKGSPPASLDTVQELAAAIGNDPNFITTITNLIATKLNISDIVDTLGSTATNRPLSANQGRLLHDRTNNSDAGIIGDAGTVNLAITDPAGVLSTKNWPGEAVSRANLGGASYNYVVLIIGQVAFRQDAGGEDIVQFYLERSLDGGATWQLLRSQYHRSTGGDMIPVTLFGIYNMTQDIQVRMRARVDTGTAALMSNLQQITVIPINRYV